jgi:dihydropyrimidinase
VTSTNAAQIFNIYPRKGSVSVGADADLVVWDPEKKHTLSVSTLHMRVDYSPLEGREVTGFPSVVMQRGNVLARDGKWQGKAGAGRFLKRGTFNL